MSRFLVLLTRLGRFEVATVGFRTENHDKVCELSGNFSSAAGSRTLPVAGYIGPRWPGEQAACPVLLIQIKKGKLAMKTITHFGIRPYEIRRGAARKADTRVARRLRPSHTFVHGSLKIFFLHPTQRLTRHGHFWYKWLGMQEGISRGSLRNRCPKEGIDCRARKSREK